MSFSPDLITEDTMREKNGNEREKNRAEYQQEVFACLFVFIRKNARVPHILCHCLRGWAHTPPALQPTFYTLLGRKKGLKCPEPKSNLFLVTQLSFSLCASSENSSENSSAIYLNVLFVLMFCVDCEQENYCWVNM